MKGSPINHHLVKLFLFPFKMANGCWISEEDLFYSMTHGKKLSSINNRPPFLLLLSFTAAPVFVYRKRRFCRPSCPVKYFLGIINGFRFCNCLQTPIAQYWNVIKIAIVEEGFWWPFENIIITIRTPCWWLLKECFCGPIGLWWRCIDCGPFIGQIYVWLHFLWYIK